MKVSVYITSFNQRALLIEAIDSVLNQSLTPHQIIVVDDCSSDGSQDVIADYARRHPKLFTPIYHPENTGVAQARNDALKAVTGDYVTYVDGDDLYLPTKLEREVAALEAAPDVQIAFSNNWWLRPDGRPDSLWIEDEKPPQGNVFVETLARAYPKGRLFRMSLIRSSAFRRVGFYDPSLSILEDWDMRIRLTQRFRTIYVDEPLSKIRRHGGGLSSAGGEVYLQVIERIIDKHRPLLEALPTGRRRWVRSRLSKWMAPKAWRAAREALNHASPRNGRWHALQMCLKGLKLNPRSIDLRLLAAATLFGKRRGT